MELSRLEAYVLALGAMVMWGIYPNLVKLSDAPWRRHFQVQSLVTLIVCLLAACTCSCIFVHFNLFVIIAMASGGICGLGVLSQVVAILLEGVVTAVPISNGLGTVLGTVILYCIEKGSHSIDPIYLFAGIISIFTAICLNAYSTTLSAASENTNQREALLPEEKAEPRRILMRPGIFFAVAAGLCFAAWPVLEDVTILDFQARLFPDVLAPFGLGFFLATQLILINDFDDDASLKSDTTQFSFRSILIAVLSGISWSLGLVLLLFAGTRLGDTVAVAIAQCNPMVAAILGIIFWNELPLQSSAPQQLLVLALSFLLFLLGIAFFFLST